MGCLRFFASVSLAVYNVAVSLRFYTEPRIQLVTLLWFCGVGAPRLPFYCWAVMRFAAQACSVAFKYRIIVGALQGLLAFNNRILAVVL